MEEPSLKPRLSFRGTLRDTFRPEVEKQLGDLSEADRKDCEVTISDEGQIIDIHGGLLSDGKYIFVIIDNERIFACDFEGKTFRKKSNKPGRIHHSDLVGSKKHGSKIIHIKPSNAGCFVVKEGRIIKIDNETGHYKFYRKLFKKSYKLFQRSSANDPEIEFTFCILYRIKKNGELEPYLLVGEHYAPTDKYPTAIVKIVIPFSQIFSDDYTENTSIIRIVSDFQKRHTPFFFQKQSNVQNASGAKLKRFVTFGGRKRSNKTWDLLVSKLATDTQQKLKSLSVSDDTLRCIAITVLEHNFPIVDDNWLKDITSKVLKLLKEEVDRNYLYIDTFNDDEQENQGKSTYVDEDGNVECNIRDSDNDLSDYEYEESNGISGDSDDYMNEPYSC